MRMLCSLTLPVNSSAAKSLLVPMTLIVPWLGVAWAGTPDPVGVSLSGMNEPELRTLASNRFATVWPFDGPMLTTPLLTKSES